MADHSVAADALLALESLAAHLDPSSRPIVEQAIGLARELVDTGSDDPAGMLRVLRLWVQAHQAALGEDWRAVFSERL